jgi:hypothetical protein
MTECPEQPAVAGYSATLSAYPNIISSKLDQIQEEWRSNVCSENANPLREDGKCTGFQMLANLTLDILPVRPKFIGRSGRFVLSI